VKLVTTRLDDIMKLENDPLEFFKELLVFDTAKIYKFDNNVE
jgi:hypothetical protein